MKVTLAHPWHILSLQQRWETLDSGADAALGMFPMPHTSLTKLHILSVFSWLEWVLEWCLLLVWKEDRAGCMSAKKLAYSTKVKVARVHPHTFAFEPTNKIHFLIWAWLKSSIYPGSSQQLRNSHEGINTVHILTKIWLNSHARKSHCLSHNAVMNFSNLAGKS